MPISKSTQVGNPQGDAPRAAHVQAASALPFWSARGATLWLGDVRACLRAMPARSVHATITSPPYWGLRDYGTATWDGGNVDCDHTPDQSSPTSTLERGKSTQGAAKEFRGTCGKCGAKRIDMQIGAEPSPDCGTHGQAQCGGCFVCSLVAVFREVYRVLRDDGTCWLNLGDSYCGGASGQSGTGPTTTMGSPNRGANQRGKRDPYKGLAPGNLVGVPWRVALALQADGWVLRQDIIWYSPNKMPESVTNRCAKSHEHIFMLTKGDGYYYDSLAIAEEGKKQGGGAGFGKKINRGGAIDNGVQNREYDREDSELVNKRDVWIIPTQGYPGAHFAVYSPRLITPCIQAGTSEHGCCAACGAPYERVVVKPHIDPDDRKQEDDVRDHSMRRNRNGIGSTFDKPKRRSGGGSHFGRANPPDNWKDGMTGQHQEYTDPPNRETVGWRKTCGCLTDEVVPALVLDPFVGSGTTVATALQLGRAGVGCDLSETYLRENAIPRIEAAMADVKVGTTRAVPKGTAPPARRLMG